MPKKKRANKRYTANRSASDVRRRQQVIRRALVSIFIVIALAATVFFLIFRRSSQLSIAENALGSFLTPIQNAVTTVTTGVRDFFQRWRDYDQLEAEFNVLAQENQQLSLELDNAEEALQENERLKALLNAQSVYESLDPIYAKVIARDAGQWFFTFAVNKGTNNGVSTGMTVVNGDGLIGRVYEVGTNYAKVMTIIDPRSGVACLIQRTRDNCILHGGVSSSDDYAECMAYYLPNINNIIPGDTVITSGTDESYPKGITVGTVRELSLNAGSEGNYAVITPAVDFQHIEEVLILRTVIERAGSSHASLPTPTPAPTPTPSPTPDSILPIDPDQEEPNWTYPSAARTPEPVTVLETLPEDAWVDV